MPSDDQTHHLLSTGGINTLHTIEDGSDRLIEEPFVILDRGLPEPEDRVAPEAKPFSYDVAGSADALYGEFPLGLISLHNMPARGLARCDSGHSFSFSRSAPCPPMTQRSPPVRFDGIR